MIDWEKIALVLYAALFGVGKWYISKQETKVESNTAEINKLKTALELNKQSDQQMKDTIEKIEKSLGSLNSFVTKYEILFEKMHKKEMEK